MPTIVEDRGVRVAFASNDCPEPPHVHVIVGRSEAKFWLTATIDLDRNHGLTKAELRTAREVVAEHREQCLRRWRLHCDPIHGPGPAGA